MQIWHSRTTRSSSHLKLDLTARVSKLVPSESWVKLKKVDFTITQDLPNKEFLRSPMRILKKRTSMQRCFAAASR